MSEKMTFNLYEKLLHLKLYELRRMYTQLNSDGWEFQEEKQGVKLYTKLDEKTGLNLVRGEGVINAPASKIMETALNLSENKEWDDTVEEGRLIEKSDNTYVIYNLLKRVGLLKRRESLTVFQPYNEEDGTIYGVGTSIEHPSVPKTNDLLRINVRMAGWVLRPLKDNPNKTFATYILHADPQGWIPKKIINWVMGEQAMNVRKIGNYVEKKFWGYRTMSQ